MDEQLQKNDRSAWGAYLTVDRADHPNIWQGRRAARSTRDDDIFETILSSSHTLIARAPRPLLSRGGDGAAELAASAGS